MDENGQVYLILDDEVGSAEDRERYRQAFFESLKSNPIRGRCENCGAKANHRTDPLFGDGPPNFTCASEKTVINSEHGY